MCSKKSIWQVLLGAWLVATLFLGGCANEPVTEKIVLKAGRVGFLGLSGNNIVYVLNANHGGEISWKLPPGLGDEPEWSSDGKWIAFSTAYTDGSHAGGVPQVYIMQSDRGRRLKLADNGTNPIWAPDGSQLVFNLGVHDIYTVSVECIKQNLACGTPTFLAKGGSPDWSPDGKQIAYHSDLPAGGIILLTLATQEAFKLPGGEGCYFPRWSPDGSQIVATCKDAIRVFKVDGSSSVSLSELGGTLPTWSPDGSRIAFVGGSSYDKNLGKGLNGEGNVRSDAIFVMNADGTDVHRLSLRNDEEVLWYSWMP